MIPPRTERIERVLAGVVRQACRDAHRKQVVVWGLGQDADFTRRVCQLALGPGGIGASGLRVHPASKTALLLGERPDADILLLGDLYYSQVVELAGSAGRPPVLERAAALCGSVQRLDDALMRFFDGRAEWQHAMADLPASAHVELAGMLRAARFNRMRLGLVPKLGARTLGIDLFA